VFESIANGGKLARWWGPAGFSNTFHAFDFTPGGRWNFTMHGPDGTDYANENEFTEIEPSQRVVIRHLSKPFFVLTIELAEVSGGTELVWTQVFDDERVAASVAHIVEPSNEQNLDRLAAVLAE
jgi:uncharacterized protein YndB with AHSA1/START domain